MFDVSGGGKDPSPDEKDCSAGGNILILTENFLFIRQELFMLRLMGQKSSAVISFDVCLFVCFNQMFDQG